MSKTIGVLGGIGPESSAVFYGELVAAFKDRFKPADNTEFPRIIINSIPAPELVLGDNEKKLGAYVDGLKFLAEESDFIVIICNTALAYFDYFSSCVTVPLLDIRKEVNRRLGSGRVLFLASPNSIDEDIFGLGKDTMIQSDEMKRYLGKIIHAYNSGHISSTDENNLMGLIDQNIDCVEHVLVACTELSLILKGWDNDKKLDTFDLLIEETLNHYATLL